MSSPSIATLMEKITPKSEDTHITLPKIHMSILAWLQCISILLTGLYFVYERVNSTVAASTEVRLKQSDLSGRMTTLEFKLDGVNNQVNKMDGKLDVLLNNTKK